MIVATKGLIGLLETVGRNRQQADGAIPLIFSESPEFKVEQITASLPELTVCRASDFLDALVRDDQKETQ